METRPADARGAALSLLALIMACLAFSNYFKPIGQALSAEAPYPTGFVLFGTRLHGMPNVIAGFIFGTLLAAYAYGVWTLRRWVLPIAIGYAGYVIVNVGLFFPYVPADESLGPVFNWTYAVIAVAVSSGGALWIYAHRRSLR